MHADVSEGGGNIQQELGQCDLDFMIHQLSLYDYCYTVKAGYRANFVISDYPPVYRYTHHSMAEILPVLAYNAFSLS